MLASNEIPKSTTLRESAAQILMAQIMSGDLAEGEIYSVAMIASMLGISPTPVREAVLELADKGLLIIRKNRGFLVPVLTRNDIEELHHIRALLEVPSTVRAGLLLGDAAAHNLRKIAKMSIEAAKSDDLVSYVKLDRNFHTQFLAELKMPSLLQLILDYRDRARLRGLRGLLGSEEIVNAAEEHISLIDAAMARDQPALQEIITHHLEKTRIRSIAELKSKIHDLG